MQRFSAVLVFGLASVCVSACKRPEPAHAISPSSARVAALAPDVTPVAPAVEPASRSVDLRGHVRWSNGDGASEAWLELRASSAPAGSKPWSCELELKTAHGAFWVSVEPGEYELTAFVALDDGESWGRSGHDFAAPRGKRRLNSPTAHACAPQGGIELVLDAGVPPTLAVVDERGAAVREATVRAWSKNDPMMEPLSTSLRDASNGWSALHVGWWDFVASAEGHAPSEIVERRLDGKVDRIELVLRRYASVSGRVVDASGIGVADARVRASYPIEWSGRLGEPHPGATTDATGGFVLDEVLPELVHLFVAVGTREKDCTKPMRLASGEQRRDLVVTWAGP